MGWTSLAGLVLLGFAPALALNALIIFRRSQLLIVEITGSFFALLALLFASLLWLIIPPLRTVGAILVFEGVLSQELARYAFIRLYDRVEKGVSSARELRGVVLNDMTSALAAATGFSVTHCLVVYGSVVSNVAGPGTFVFASCGMSIFALTAAMIFLTTLLHIFLFLAALGAYRTNSRWMFALIGLLHLAAGYGSLLNTTGSACWGSLLLMAAVDGVAFFLARRTFLAGDLHAPAAMAR